MGFRNCILLCYCIITLSTESQSAGGWNRVQNFNRGGAAFKPQPIFRPVQPIMPIQSFRPLVTISPLRLPFNPPRVQNTIPQLPPLRPGLPQLNSGGLKTTNTLRPLGFNFGLSTANTLRPFPPAWSPPPLPVFRPINSSSPFGGVNSGQPIVNTLRPFPPAWSPPPLPVFRPGNSSSPLGRVNAGLPTVNTLRPLRSASPLLPVQRPVNTTSTNQFNALNQMLQPGLNSNAFNVTKRRPELPNFFHLSNGSSTQNQSQERKGQLIPIFGPPSNLRAKTTKTPVVILPDYDSVEFDDAYWMKLIGINDNSTYTSSSLKSAHSPAFLIAIIAIVFSLFNIA